MLCHWLVKNTVDNGLRWQIAKASFYQKSKLTRSMQMSTWLTTLPFICCKLCLQFPPPFSKAANILHSLTFYFSWWLSWSILLSVGGDFQHVPWQTIHTKTFAIYLPTLKSQLYIIHTLAHSNVPCVIVILDHTKGLKWQQKESIAQAV